MNMGMRAKILARSFFIQSFWSLERMQGLGFAFCLEPWLKLCWRQEPEQARLAVLRHQEFFNTQPYMAAMVAGTVCALEEEAASAAADRDSRLEKILALKKSLAAALAGIGDALFWGALRPFCAALAALAALGIWAAGAPQKALFIPALYLLAYDGPALALRWIGFETGFARKEGIAQALKGFPWQSVIRGLRLAGSVLVAAGAALLLARTRSAAGAGVFAAAGAFFKLVPRATGYKLYGAACLLGALASLAGRP